MKWFWHQKGCQNGADCEYCHLCSKEEIKVRRKLKISLMRSGSSPPQPSSAQAHGLRCGEDLNSEEGPCPLVQRVTAEPVGPELCTISFGSRMHGTGNCRPCAFFWKPAGCNSGNECVHCHLCPDGEKRRRKKQLAQHSGTTISYVSKQLTAQNYLIMQQQQQLTQLQMQLQMQQQMMMASISCLGTPQV